MNSEQLLLLIHDLVVHQYPKKLRSLISIASQDVFITISQINNGPYLELEMSCKDNLIKINCFPGVEMTEDELTNQIKKLLFL